MMVNGRLFLRIPFLLLIVFSCITACQREEQETESDVPVTIASEPVLPTVATPLALEQTNDVLPAMDAMVLCEDEAGTHLWHFDAQDQMWDKHTPEFLQTPGFISQGLMPFEDGENVLIYGVRVDETENTRFEAYLWADGAAQHVLDETQVYEVMPQIPGNALAHLYATRTDNRGAIYALDMEQCLTGECRFMPVNTLVHPSPQNDQALVWNSEDWTLQLSETGEQNGNEIDRGWAPFWLDENRVGYLRVMDAATGLGDAQASLVLRDVNGEASELLTSEEAKELLVQQGIVDEMATVVLFNAKGTPTHSNIVLVSAIDLDSPEQAFLFDVESETGLVRIIPEMTAVSLSELELTPDGQFLVSQTADELQLYALATGEITSYPLEHVASEERGYAFSNDGARLLLPNGDKVYLIQSGSEDFEEINLAGQYCTQGAWLDVLP